MDGWLIFIDCSSFINQIPIPWNPLPFYVIKQFYKILSFINVFIFRTYKALKWILLEMVFNSCVLLITRLTISSINYPKVLAIQFLLAELYNFKNIIILYYCSCLLFLVDLTQGNLSYNKTIICNWEYFYTLLCVKYEVLCLSDKM